MSIEWHVWTTTMWSAALLAFVRLPRSTLQGRHLSDRLSSKRRLLHPECHRRASASENRPVPVRLSRERRLLSWPERRSPRRASGRRMPSGLPCERRVLPQEPLEHQSARFAERRFRSPPARFPAPLYGHSWEPESHPGCSARSQAGQSPRSAGFPRMQPPPV